MRSTLRRTQIQHQEATLVAATAGFGCGAWLVGLTISFLLGMWLWPYTINAWLLFSGKKAVVFEWWQAGLLGAVPVFGQMMVPAAFITWVLMLILL